MSSSRSFFRRPELSSSLPLPAPWWPCAESLWRCFPCTSCTKRARSWHIPLCTACPPETPPLLLTGERRTNEPRADFAGELFSSQKTERSSSNKQSASTSPRNRAEEPACLLHDIKEGAARTGGLTPSRIPYPLRWTRRNHGGTRSNKTRQT